MFGLAIHGGAGTLPRAEMSSKREQRYRAGLSGVFTIDGRNELDASIMDGATLRAGAVSGVTHIKNPIELARTVMEHSDYVLLAGSGTEEFALTRGFGLVPRSYFHTA